jgi:hypothetical protein
MIQVMASCRSLAADQILTKLSSSLIRTTRFRSTRRVSCVSETVYMRRGDVTALSAIGRAHRRRKAR